MAGDDCTPINPWLKLTSTDYLANSAKDIQQAIPHLASNIEDSVKDSLNNRTDDSKVTHKVELHASFQGHSS